MNDSGDSLRDFHPNGLDHLRLREERLAQQREATLRQSQAASQRLKETDDIAEALIRDVFRPLLDELHEVLDSARVMCGGSVNQDRRRDGKHFCHYRAIGNGRRGKHYHVGVSALASEDGMIELLVECRCGTGRECSRGVPTATLVESAPKNLSAAVIDPDALRQWCAGLLAKCADAVIAACRAKA